MEVTMYNKVDTTLNFVEREKKMSSRNRMTSFYNGLFLICLLFLGYIAVLLSYRPAMSETVRFWPLLR